MTALRSVRAWCRRVWRAAVWRAPVSPITTGNARRISADSMESFERAFGSGCSGCCGTCACGRTFYNPDDTWDWEEGELERLQASSNATPLSYGVGHVEFEGTSYCWDCDCWRKRAAQIVGFLLGHQFQIAEFLKAERDRLMREAKAAPTVGD